MRERIKTLSTDVKNGDTNQIQVLFSDPQNARKCPSVASQVVAVVKKGFYSYTERIESEGFIWYHLGKDMWVAGVPGRVEECRRAEYAIKGRAPVHGTYTIDKQSAAAGDSVTISAHPDDGYRVRCFSINGEYTQEETFTMPPQECIIRVFFEAISFKVSTSVEGEGICRANRPYARVNDTVIVECIPSEGFVLSRLSVNGLAIEHGRFSMPPKDVQISATFKRSDMVLRFRDTVRKKIHDLFAKLS